MVIPIGQALPITLLPYEPVFLQPFIQWRSEPLSLRHNPLKRMSTEEIAAMLQAEGSRLSDLRRHESYRWFIAIEGQVVGSVSLKNISYSMGYGEIGYGIAAAHHRKGIGAAAVRLLVDKIFSESPLRKLIAYVHEENQASRRLLEKLGFQEEGLLREHYLINGVPVNEIFYGLLKSEWTQS